MSRRLATLLPASFGDWGGVHLQRGGSRAISDHLPPVVDFEPRE